MPGREKSKVCSDCYDHQMPKELGKLQKKKNNTSKHFLSHFVPAFNEKKLCDSELVLKAVECVGQCHIRILIIHMFVMGTKLTFVVRKTRSAKAAWAWYDSSLLNCSLCPIQMQCKCRMIQPAITVPRIKHTRFALLSCSNWPLVVSVSSWKLSGLKQWHPGYSATSTEAFGVTFLGGNSIGGDCEPNYLSFILQHY